MRLLCIHYKRVGAVHVHGGSVACRSCFQVNTTTPARSQQSMPPCDDPAGDSRTDVSLSEDGTKRIITKTGVYSGTELHLWALPPYHDDRLPLRPDRRDLCFDVPRREITSSEEWQQVRPRTCTACRWQAHTAAWEL